MIPFIPVLFSCSSLLFIVMILIIHYIEGDNCVSVILFIAKVSALSSACFMGCSYFAFYFGFLTILLWGICRYVPETGKLITWGSANDEVQSYLTSGKHGVML